MRLLLAAHRAPAEAVMLSIAMSTSDWMLSQRSVVNHGSRVTMATLVPVAMRSAVPLGSARTAEAGKLHCVFLADTLCARAVGGVY